MVLEALDRNRINIKDLTVEDPAKRERLPFDPDRDISQSDWIGVLEQLNGFKERKRWLFFSRLAASLKLLFPDRLTQLGLTTEAVMGIKGEADRLNSQPIREHNYWFLKSLAILLPKEVWRGRYAESAWNKVKPYFENHRTDITSVRACEAVFLAFPDRAKELSLDDQIWQEKVSSIVEDFQVPDSPNLDGRFSDRVPRL